VSGPRQRAARGREKAVARKPGPKPVASSLRQPAVAGREKPVDPERGPERPQVAAVRGHEQPAARGPVAEPAARRPRQPAIRVREAPIALEPAAKAARRRGARGPAKPIAAEPVARPAPLLGLTRRDLGILELVAAGRTDEQIGEQLLITRQTASAHVSRIVRKLGVGSRREAAEIARQSAAAGKS
jgi:DNA-binding CsgD family transcriptional regulator